MCRVNCFCFSTELLAKRKKTLVWGEYKVWTFLVQGPLRMILDVHDWGLSSAQKVGFSSSKRCEKTSLAGLVSPHEAYLNWTEIWLTTERMYMMYIFWGMPKSPSFTVGGFSSTVFLGFTTLTGAPLWNLDFPGPKKTILEVSPNFQHLQGDLPGRFGDL